MPPVPDVGSTRVVRAAAAVDGFFARHRRAAIGLGALAVVAEGLRIVSARKMGDFGAVHLALRRLTAGETLYVGNTISTAYVYSPLVALVLAPLGLASAGVARFLWFVGGWGVLVLAWRLAAGLVGDGVPAATGRRALAVASVWYFAYYNGLIGQVTPHLVALVLLAEVAARRRQAALAGLSLAGAVLVKPFPALLLAYHALRRQGAVVGWTLLFVGVGLALPALWFGAGYPAVLRGWLAVNRQQQTLYSIVSWPHQSISAMVYRLAGRSAARPFALDPRDPAALAIAAIVVGLLVVTVWATVRSRDGTDPIRGDAAFALYLLDWALLPPTSWKHYYVTLLFPGALLARLAVAPGRWRRAAQGMLGTLVVTQLALAAVKPPGRQFVLYEWSTCVWLGLAVFALCAAIALGPDGAGAPSEGLLHADERDRGGRRP